MGAASRGAAAPATAAALFDAVVGAWSFSGESWQEAGAAVAAENSALDWIRSLAGMPDGSAGCFVSGGSAGNLSALAVARETAKRERGLTNRPKVVVSLDAHSSITNTLMLLEMDALVVETDDHRLTRSAVERMIARTDPWVLDDVVAVVSTAAAGPGRSVSQVWQVRGRDQ